MNIEEDNTIKAMMNILKSTDVSSFIDASKVLFPMMPENFDAGEFTKEAVEIFDCMRPNSYIKEDDYTIRILHMIRESKGYVQLLLSSMLVVCPHSMTVERVVSLHNILKSDRRESTELETLNHRLYISMNGPGTAQYDPRPAIIQFFKDKSRRQSSTSLDSYKMQFFAAKFFGK